VSDYMTLLGAEDVKHAGSTMRVAADTIARASGELSQSLRDDFVRLSDSLARIPTFEDLVVASFLHWEIIEGGSDSIGACLHELSLPPETVWDSEVHWPKLCAKRAKAKAEACLRELGR
jgi:hypothetical protein